MVESRETVQLDENDANEMNNMMLESEDVAPDIYQNEQKAADIFTSEMEFEFSVRNPHDKSGHIVYEVKGRDNQGLFDGTRRFNEFYALHEALTKRWPGCLIPPVPSKQKFGNKDLVFIQERRYYLERFLRKLSRYSFIINGPEFQIFARPVSNDIEKALSKLPKMTPQELYERMTKASGIDESQYVNVMNRHEAGITELKGFMKKVEPFLKQLKGDLARSLSTKQRNM